jgi:hypothetical protein
MASEVSPATHVAGPTNELPWPLTIRFRFLAVRGTADVRDAHGQLRYVIRRGGGLLTRQVTVEGASGRRVVVADEDRGGGGVTLYPLHLGSTSLGTLQFQMPRSGLGAQRHYLDVLGETHRIDAQAATIYTARRSNGVPLLRLARKRWTLMTRYQLEAMEHATVEERAMWLPAMLVLAMIVETDDPAIPTNYA